MVITSISRFSSKLNLSSFSTPSFSSPNTNQNESRESKATFISQKIAVQGKFWSQEVHYIQKHFAEKYDCLFCRPSFTERFQELSATISRNSPIISHSCQLIVLFISLMFICHCCRHTKQLLVIAYMPITMCWLIFYRKSMWITPSTEKLSLTK